MSDNREIVSLRKQVRALQLGLLGAFCAPFLAAYASADEGIGENADLKVRSLAVIDANGVERVFIGAPVHGPIVDGVEQQRIGEAAGILINGPDGDERGGYLTSDRGGEAVLTLDSADGAEVFKVVANPTSGASLFLQHQNGALVALTTYRGEPEQQHYASDGKRALAVPSGVAELE